MSERERERINTIKVNIKFGEEACWEEKRTNFPSLLFSPIIFFFVTSSLPSNKI